MISYDIILLYYIILSARSGLRDGAGLGVAGGAKHVGESNFIVELINVIIHID